MKQKFLTTFTITTIVVAVLYIPSCYSTNCYTVSYSLLQSFNSSEQYRLYVAIPQSLYEYYRGMDHSQISIEDFAKFVTPFPLKPIADKLWEIYSTPEDFANGVLMIVHQIPYKAMSPAKYPIETMVDNIGDCDLFSYVAASIMKAGGLDVVLLYYPNHAHMNIGVCLPTPPKHVRAAAHFVTYNGSRFYVAECTGDNWINGWRVGECPDDLLRAECQIIPLKNCEEWAPQQVSASYKQLQPSTVSLTIPSNFGVQGSTLSLFGQLTPKLQNKSVTIYFKVGNSPWNVLATTYTDAEGKFSWTWISKEAGICQFRASWSGDDEFSGADSPVVTVIILPTFFIAICAITLILVCVGVIFLISSQSSHKNEELTLSGGER
ncbi:MAG: hypothetical protein QXL77_03630 [Candidatus Bathyarchaeia archaeon]